MKTSVSHHPQPSEPTTMGDSTLSGPLTHAHTRASQSAGEFSSGYLGYRGAELAASLLRKVFRRLPFSFAVRLWTGTTVVVGGADSQATDARFTLWFKDPHAVSALILGKDPLRLRFDRRAATYWIERTPPGPPPETMTNQF